MDALLAVVPGEGIGPSIVSATRQVLDAAFQATGNDLEYIDAPSKFARDEYGMCLDAQSRSFYEETFGAGVPILHGPAGGRFVYELRREYDLAFKLTPIAPLAHIADASPLREGHVVDTDILIVRDNAAGLYQGAFGWREDGRVAFHEASYDVDTVRALLGEAARVARTRNGHLTVVTKPGGVPTISAMWRSVAIECAGTVATSPGDQNLDVNFLEIDNACYQLVTNPGSFDVIAAPNMFGDVLGDTAAVLLGSRGMSYSANFSADGRSVYQTAHGAAHDLAGRDVANPVAQILTAAWMLRSSLNAADEADLIESAVRLTLASGWRTVDIASSSSRVTGTAELAARIAETVRESAF